MNEHDDGVDRRQLLGASALAFLGAACTFGGAGEATARSGGFEITKTDAEWRRVLKPAQYYILRQEGTERPYTSPLNDEHRAGTFLCAGCRLPVYASSTKFDSHTGWPSFYQPLKNAIGTSVDYKIGIPRTEVHCRRCGGHLGHVFDDGPPPTGKRYCMNGAAMLFQPKKA